MSPWWSGAAAARLGSPQLTRIPQEEKGNPLQCWGCTSGLGWATHPIPRVMQNAEQDCFCSSKPPRLALRSPRCPERAAAQLARLPGIPASQKLFLPLW